MRISIKPNRLLIFLLSLAIVLEGRSIWIYFTGVGGLFRASIKAFILVIFVLMLLFNKRLKITKGDNVGGVTLSVIVYVLLYGILSRYKFGTLFIWLVCSCVIAYEMLFFETKEDRSNGIPLLLSYYSDIIFVIAIVSLIFWLLGGILHIIPITDEYIYTWSDPSNGSAVYSYFNLYYTVGPQKALGITIDRNSAIFAEAPMAALHFSLSLLIEIFLKRKVSRKRILFLVMAIISTLSTMAYIVIIISALGKCFISKSRNPGEVFFKVILIALGILGAYYAINNMLTLKMQQLSGIWRMNDYEVGYNVWRQNVFLGVGFQNDKAIQDMMPAWRAYNMGFSNSIMQLLAQGGLMLFVLYLLSFIKGVRYAFSRKQLNYALFILCFIYLFIVCVFTYNFVTVMILIYLFDINRYISNFTFEED